MDGNYKDINMRTICRICLNSNSVMKSLLEEDFVDLFEEITTLEFYETDFLPTLLCIYCIDNLKHFKLFRLKAIENDIILRNVLKTQENKNDHIVFLDTSHLASNEMGNNSEVIDNVQTNGRSIANNSNEKFECNVCKKEVKSSHSLRRHMKIHSGIKPYECNFCGKRFLEQGNLTKHVRKHNKDKKHQCNECGLRFYERNKLMIHIRTHTGERPFTCKVCTKAFTTQAQVHIHMKTHTGERPYSCIMCQKTFAYSSSLDTHKKIHNNEHSYVCNECGRSFTQKVNLLGHIRSKHTNECPFMCSKCGQAVITCDIN